MTGSADLNPHIPHPARRYDYWLGGKDNFAADRASADYVEDRFPTVRETARQNRAFLRRAVTTLAAEHGIRQFLDIGAGLPTAENTHQVAQSISPDARVVYVDNDPIVATHARALLIPDGTPGATALVEADLRAPGTVLADPLLRTTLDLTQPVGLLLVAVLHFLAAGDRPHAIVRTLLDTLAPGSWLVLSHASQDLLTDQMRSDADRVIKKSAIPMTLRSRDEILRFFAGLELADPGLVAVHRWRQTGDPAGLPADTDIGVYGALARKTRMTRAMAASPPRTFTPR